MLIIGLLIWAMSTYVLYSYISAPLLVENKSKELMPQVEWIAERSGKYFLTRDPLVENLVEISDNFFSVWTMIIIGDVIKYTPLPSELSHATQKELHRQVRSLHTDNIQGRLNKDYGIIRIEETKSDYLYVLADIRSDLVGDASTPPLGTAIIIQPMADFDLGVQSLNLALLISSLICFVILLFPIVFMTRKIIMPIIGIRRVALSITEGNFNDQVLVDPRRNDEISDLAHAINHMSDTLNNSLSELSLERNQLKEIINGISEGIIAVDIDSNIIQINEVIWRLFQRDPEYYSAEEILKLNEINSFFEECFKTEEPVTDIIALADDKRIIQVSINPIYDHNHEISAAVGLFRDITKSERLEQTRRDYIANVSHELRTPITAMRALIEPLRDGMVKSEDDRQRYYNIIFHETLRLSRLINDMLELSRLQSGTTYIEQGPINLNIFLRGLCSHFSFIAEERGRKLKTENLDEELPLVWGNEDRIEQILMTYIDNALKFTEENGLIILRVLPLNQQLQIEIEDNGSGIAAEDIPYVFERFYKADKAHDEEGTGLGLSIAKALAEQLNMTVSVRSVKGEGSVFALGINYVSDVMRTERHIKEVYDFFETDLFEKKPEQVKEEGEASDNDKESKESEVEP